MDQIIERGCGLDVYKEEVIAVAHTILQIAYQMLSRQVDYHDVGVDYFDRRHTERVKHRAIQLLERQGYRVVLQPAA